MATTARETSQGKEKTPKPKPSTTPAATQVKKPSRPSLASSSTSKGLAILTDKPSPHYLRPTISSTKDPCIFPKKQSSDDESHGHGRRKAIEKPASSAQLKRTMSANSRQTRIKSPSPGKTTPLKAASPTGKVTKTWAPKTSKPQPVSKSASVKKTTSASTTTPATKPKKVSKPSTQKPTDTNTTPSPEASETPSDKVEEAKADVEGVGEEVADAVKEEPESVQVESSPVNDQTSADPAEPELQNSGSGYSSILTEDSELVTKGEEVANSEEPEPPKDKEQSDNIEEDKKEYTDENKEEEVVKVEEPEVETGKDENTDNTASPKEVEDEEETPRKLNFKQGKELEVKEGESGGLQRLKFKERKEDSEGRKESPAYNDVIEETASKLVGKRKSKVKALVGAFETVINLENDAPQNEGGE